MKLNMMAKLVVMPFVEDVEAQRSSTNRVQGTVELKGINVTPEDFFQRVEEIACGQPYGDQNTDGWRSISYW